MWTDRRDGRVLGRIFAAIGMAVLLIVIWDRLDSGAMNSSLLIGGFTLIMVGSLLMRRSLKKDEPDAG